MSSRQHTEATIVGRGRSFATTNLADCVLEEWLRALGPAFDVELVENDHGMVLVSRPALSAPDQPATPE